jgi:hypothetical protein
MRSRSGGRGLRFRYEAVCCALVCAAIVVGRLWRWLYAALFQRSALLSWCATLTTEVRW